MLDEEEVKKDIQNFKKRYIGKYNSVNDKSEEYFEFKKQLLPFHFTLYERVCNFSSKLIKLKINKKRESELQEALATCHLNTTPSGVTSFAIFFPFLLILLGFALSFLISTYLLQGQSLMFFIFVFLIFGLVLIIPLSTLPIVWAKNWRLKSSNQMVLAVFYIVSYMRHTSNLELAIKFTSDHLAPPLSIDFKKILWNVETSRFDSIKSSLDNYLASWKKYNMEFVESIHLIESSLFETAEKKRILTLEKAMSLILESTYEKMLHFAQDLKSPITMLHMLGVILPILGLVILPLVVSFMGNVKWYYISVLYNVFLPLIVFYFGKVILTTRPTGYGQADITEVNPELKKYRLMTIRLAGKRTYSLNPKWIAIIISILVISVGFIPLFMNLRNNLKGEYFDIIIENNQVKPIYNMTELKKAQFSFLGYRVAKNQIRGPYGLGSTIISLAIPLGLALGLSFYYKTTTKKLIKIREKTKKLENEFASALYQLGNRLGDGLPAELAFKKAADIMENTSSGKFFDLVYSNIVTIGMGVESAIFDKKYGAINKFPSALIESSMKVFAESIKKGPDVASKALINISTYIKEMHRVDERLKDLMSEITTSMKSQINFLAPLISGIVIGLTSMITTILGTLSTEIQDIAGGNPAMDVLGQFSDSIPPYYFQIVVGLYIVQITYLLTIMLNIIQNGYDPLNEKYLLGQNLLKSGLLYTIVSLAVILIFNIIASVVITNTTLMPA